MIQNILKRGAKKLPAFNVVSIGHPVLRRVAADYSVSEILAPETKELVERLKETIRVRDGIGVAAPQVNISKKLVVVYDSSNHIAELPTGLFQIQELPEPLVLFNPIVVPKNPNKTVLMQEACFSVPNMMGVVPRVKDITVYCLDERAEPLKIEASGFWSGVLQHEIDHLYGKLFVERIKELGKDFFMQEYMDQQGDMLKRITKEGSYSIEQLSQLPPNLKHAL